MKGDRLAMARKAVTLSLPLYMAMAGDSLAESTYAAPREWGATLRYRF